MSQSSERLNKLLLQHPGLIAAEHEGRLTIRGTIKLKGAWYRLSMQLPHFPQLQDMHLCVQQLHQVQSYNASSSGVNLNWTVEELLEHMPQLLKQPDHGRLAETLAQTPTQNIYAEVAALYAPHAYQIQLNAICSRIRFCKFAQHEQHFLELELPTLRLWEHSLPDGSVSWTELLGKCDTLTALLQQFLKYLEELQPFYDNFTDIDELCYVVQPGTPSTKHNWRLFLLRERVFLKLLIADAFAPLSSMSLHIIGPTHEVEQLRRTYSEGLSSWDAELDIHKNLLRIFDLCFFPMPPAASPCGNGLEATAASQPYCNICYAYQLERGEIPIISCDNTHCSLIFHAACLKEWFNTLSDGKVFLDVSFGTCPFCKAKLSTSFAELLEN